MNISLTPLVTGDGYTGQKLSAFTFYKKYIPVVLNSILCVNNHGMAVVIVK